MHKLYTLASGCDCTERRFHEIRKLRESEEKSKKSKKSKKDNLHNITKRLDKIESLLNAKK